MAAGRTVMYESPKLQNRLSRTFIRARVLVNVQEPLISGFWVPRLNKKPIRVTARYERLQHYCYNCGRIGHEARNCKFQFDRLEEEAEKDRLGNGLGTAYVKTIEEALVAYAMDWDEAKLLLKNTSADDRTTLHQADGIVITKIPTFTESQQTCNNPNHENSKQQGANSDIPDQRQIVPSNGHILINSELNAHDHREILITKVPVITHPIQVNPGNQLPSTRIQSSAIGEFTPSKIKMPPTQESQSSISRNQTPQTNSPYYRVDFLASETDDQSALVPFAGLSPISAVTSGLNKIQLKRSLSS
ncbi:hypothetical protein K1719_023216 [Acacia pycnantha]|nr:hypothetical protein K1719_023216 [Acacia pycnantha]